MTRREPRKPPKNLKDLVLAPVTYLESWLYDLFRYRYDGFFRGGLAARDDRPSRAYIDLLSRVDELKAVKPETKRVFREQLNGALVQVLRKLLPVGVLAPAALHEALRVVSNHEIRDAVDILVPIAREGRLCHISHKGSRLHLTLLQTLCALYVYGHNASAEDRERNGEILDLLRKGIEEPHYCSVAFGGLYQIEGDKALKRLPDAVECLMRSATPEPLQKFQRQYSLVASGLQTTKFLRVFQRVVNEIAGSPALIDADIAQSWIGEQKPLTTLDVFQRLSNTENYRVLRVPDVALEAVSDKIIDVEDAFTAPGGYFGVARVTPGGRLKDGHIAEVDQSSPHQADLEGYLTRESKVQWRSNKNVVDIINQKLGAPKL